MKLTTITGYIGVATILIIFGGATFFFITFVQSCNNGNLYQAGSGVGSLVDIEKEKYKSEYLKKYADTLLKHYPQYNPLPNDILKSMTAGDDVLDITNIYFSKYPKETYSVQWSGTGFISVRFAYDYEKGEEIIENIRKNSIIGDSVKERMTKRFRIEILDKIDSIISKSKDSINAILKLPI
jgi:hypothetical protein